METKFSKILVPIDGSKFSMDAAEYGIVLSNKYNAELSILHVLHPGEIGEGIHYFGTEVPEQTKKLIEERKDEVYEWFDSIKNLSKKYAKEKEIQIKTEIIESHSVVSSITEFSEKNNVDLIVMGTKGRTGIKRLLLGSVASKVMTYSHCPVLIVR
ncbi:MAG: universal stress protein [Nitrososphaeraceae archaeon]|nr:universal stress protein [Nitrososphaeraceae archaeon]